MSLYFRITLIVYLALFLCQDVSCAVLNVPARRGDALSGSEFVTLITPMTLTNRENAILNEVVLGNIPNFMRNLKPITVSATVNSQLRTVVYHVLPDYLAIGSDEDYFLTPMSPLCAQRIADRLGCLLPTRKMVNDIWAQAQVKLSPSTIPPSPEMTTVPVFAQHNATVRAQRLAVEPQFPLGALVGGDKKDVVITKLLATTPNKVAIYGWHYTSGSPIQPLYLGHEDTYADYSHGIRLVQQDVMLDGQPTTAVQILNDANLNVLLSDEGVVISTRYPVALPLYFPLQDDFPSSGRDSSIWTDKFTTPTLLSFSPTSPGGDGTVLRVRDAAGGMETTRTGNTTDADYFVQCDIYCTYRPELVGDGFERCGIFIRDNGNGSFEHTTGGGGYCYAMAWDSGNGRLWCLKSVNGVITDLNPAPIYRPSTAWRRMRIEAQGDQLRFLCDGELILSVTDSTHRNGQCGIGYHEYFATNSNMIGTIADNFLADELTLNTKGWMLY